MPDTDSPAEQVSRFLSSAPLRFRHRPPSDPKGFRRYWKHPVDFTNLPRHPTSHFRGVLIPGHSTYGMFLDSAEMLPQFFPRKHRREFVPWEGAVLVHCKPLDHEDNRVRSGHPGDENRFPDIPDRWDIYLLLRHQFDSFAFTGATMAAMICRTERSWRAILQLRDWEQSSRGRNRYNRIKRRLEKLGQQPTEYQVWRSYAASALRHLGLSWPGKPNERRAAWVHCVQALGLVVLSGTPHTPEY